MPSPRARLVAERRRAGEPRAWLISTGRFKAIDRLRRGARFNAALAAAAEQLEASAPHASDFGDDSLEDDRLRLIFTCCHPALSADARIALTLREVCGLETEEIARAFLIPAPTLAQRIVRAKGKIRDAPNPLPGPVACRTSRPSRRGVHVLYLVFNEVTQPRLVRGSFGTIFRGRRFGWAGS